jgi:Txe/YoeB family toxin of Txe-Axe toxin-antitoxin module
MLKVKWTPRFEQRLDRYNGIQDYVASKTAGLVRKYEADPINWSYNLEKLKDKSFNSTQVYRLPITSGDRLVFVIDDKELILADIGDHDVMDEYARMPRLARNNDLANATLPAEWFIKRMNQSLNSTKSSTSKVKTDLKSVLNEPHQNVEERWVYEEELDEGWIQYLDENQNSVVENIIQELLSQTEDLKVHFIYGGPGTGKTVVLLNLALRLEKLGKSFSFQLNDQVAKYLNRGRERVPGVNLGFGPGVTVLLDDPESIDEFAYAIRKAQATKCRALIIGFDPLQWHERKMEVKLKSICDKTNYTFSQLWVCYRQSFGVAKKSIELTKVIFERSSRFFDQSKIAGEKADLQEHLDLIEGMEFVDEAGRYLVYKEALELKLEDENKRYSARLDIWKHSPSICFVYEDVLLQKWRPIVKDLYSGHNKIDLALSKYRMIRGVEFQEVMLIITNEFWNKLNVGENGLNSENWEKITSLHTIFSRAKDSIVVYVDNKDLRSEV